jgi:hypothetical protein
LTLTPPYAQANLDLALLVQDTLFYKEVSGAKSLAAFVRTFAALALEIELWPSLLMDLNDNKTIMVVSGEQSLAVLVWTFNRSLKVS